MSASEVFSSKAFRLIIASLIGVLPLKVEARNPNLPEITDDHPQSRPHRQLLESAARAASLPASYTTRRDTITCAPNIVFVSAGGMVQSRDSRRPNSKRSDCDK
jgi:hypothetical protein